MRLPRNAAIIYNAPSSSHYDAAGEAKAMVAVVEEVEAVEAVLLRAGYRIQAVPLLPPRERAYDILRSITSDVVFNLFEGFGDDAEAEAYVASALADNGLPFTGCPGTALALGLYKSKAKETLVRNGISTPRYCVLKPGDISDFGLAFPCIVKPGNEDASHGLSPDSVVFDKDSLRRQVKKISRLFAGEVLVEEFIDGREFNVTVMGNDDPSALPVSEIVYSLPPDMPRIITFEGKWEKDSVFYRGTKPVCPAELTVREQLSINTLALSAYKAIGCRGYARIDMRQDIDGDIKVLEVNPNPDIAPDSGAARQARAARLTYDAFILKIVQLAMENKR